MWKIIGCAVQGQDHDISKIPCQDKISRFRNKNISVIALADGAGSASLSHFGAEKVVNSICAKLAEDFNNLINNSDIESVKSDILNYLVNELTKLSIEKYCNIKALASTLMAVAADDENYFALHIGDGVIGAFINDKIKVMSEPFNGEYAGTTVFVTSNDALKHMKIFKGKLSHDNENISGFVLMSDGAGESFYYRREKTLIPWLEVIKQNCVKYPEDVREQVLIQDFENKIKPRTMDDCSMILMCRFVETQERWA